MISPIKLRWSKRYLAPLMRPTKFPGIPVSLERNTEVFRQTESRVAILNANAQHQARCQTGLWDLGPDPPYSSPSCLLDVFLTGLSASSISFPTPNTPQHCIFKRQIQGASLVTQC